MNWIPSINDQINAMGRKWPSFRVVERDAGTVVWHGEIQPLLMTYILRISYRMPLAIQLINPLRMQPEVRVLNPLLERRDDSIEGPLPHVYWDDPERPMLCLFDPANTEWSPDDLIADTTVRWAADWLACYEGWRATGNWAGGGRHAVARIT